jgi:hypothetical protein
MAKEEHRVAKQQDLIIRAQARATAEMAAANARKAQILQNQAALSLFTMPRVPTSLMMLVSTWSCVEMKNSPSYVAASP